MSDVKRYSIRVERGIGYMNSITDVLDENGDYVFYTDHQAALAARDAKVRELVERWRSQTNVDKEMSERNLWASIEMRQSCADELEALIGDK